MRKPLRPRRRRPTALLAWVGLTIGFILNGTSAVHLGHADAEARVLTKQAGSYDMAGSGWCTVDEDKASGVVECEAWAR